MKYMMNRVINCSIFLHAFLLLLYIVNNVKADDESTEIILDNENTSVYVNVERYFRNIRNWFYDNLPYLRQEAGRCFAAGIRKLQFTFLPIFYKLGVIGTMLVFLTIISMKGLTVGVIILILSLSNYLAKLHIAKHGNGENIKNLHVHIHPNQGHGYHHEDDYHYNYHRSDHKPMTYSSFYKEPQRSNYQHYSNPADKTEQQDIGGVSASGVVNTDSGYFLNFLRGSNMNQ